MRHIVDAIAAQGRHGDDELIHVSKNEIAGLDGLSRRVYGRDLPRNPRTGLKEASWLQAVLPAAVGIGAGVLTANPFVGAAAGAAAGAGTSAAEGGTTEQALMAGVMGGIAGYGGAGIGAGLTGAGEAAAGEVAKEAVAETAKNAATNTATGAAANTTAGVAVPQTGLTSLPGAGSFGGTGGATVGEVGGASSLGTTGGTSSVAVPQTALSNTPNAVQEVATVDLGANTVTSPTGQVTPATSPNVGPFTGQTPPGQGLNWGSLTTDKGISNLTKLGTGAAAGYMAQNGQPAPIEEPGKQSTENPYEGELYYGPEGELRSRAVLKAAEGGMMYGDYDAVDAQPDGGYAPGGLASFADGGDVKGDFNAKDVGTYMDEQGGLESLTPEEAKAARMMRLARYLGPNRRPEGYADGGGIGMVRAMQPGGAWGGATADLYGVVDKNAPWLTKIQPGGFMGALQPGRMDYEDRKRQEAADKEAQAQEQAAAIQKAKQVAQLEALRTNVPQMAGGGIASFGKGRYLQGPGDGMSDSIPADIDGKRPARLATGEFVVPADVVSGLGNGDSTSGAKQLHSMMDRVRMARTGTKKQGKQINPNKVMPV